jgi:hypothetical protein
VEENSEQLVVASAGNIAIGRDSQPMQPIQNNRDVRCLPMGTLFNDCEIGVREERTKGKNFNEGDFCPLEGHHPQPHRTCHDA